MRLHFTNKKIDLLKIKFLMKKVLFTIAMLFVLVAYGQKDYSVIFDQPKSDVYQLTFNVDKWNLETVTHDGVSYEKIGFSQSTVTEEKGWAELPFISASVQLPAQKDVDLNIVYSDYQDIQLNRPLLPSRGVIYRNQNPEELPYQIDPQSIVDRFYPETLAYSEEPFIIRDVRGTSVRVFPFQWNAATQTLRVYGTVTVELVENQNPATNPLLKENNTPLREAIGMYESMFINFEKTRYDLPAAEFGEILVITTDRDAETIDSYIQWKKERGYVVHKEIVATGTNVKSTIQNLYDANPNILYVQLIGDWADIQCETSGYGTSPANSPMDPKLGCVVGTDNFPEIAVARFSCSNADQLNVQINKSINYEKNPSMDADWHESFIGIASNEGPGDDGEIDYVHVQRIYNQKLEPFTYATHYQNYAPGANASNLTGHLNTGASTIAYTGHGSKTTFVTTGFSNSHINQLTNGDKLPFITACACNTGEYQGSGDCFGEAWLKKENGGAIAALFSSISQAWTPPMVGQDYFYDILIGGFDYAQYSGQNGLTTTEQRTTWGSIVVNAFNCMLTESNSSSMRETVNTWISFGDASIQLRTKQPDIIASSNNMILSNIPFETTITQDGTPVEGALVCISKNDKYYKAFTDADGKVSIEQDFTPGEVRLVVTGFNLKTIYETIQCIAPDGPYLQFEEIAVNDENGQLDYSDESVSLNLTVKNIGQDKAENISATITSDDEYITIVTGTATLPLISAGNSATFEDVFEISVPANIPDQHEVLFHLVMNDGGSNSWEATFSIVANAPNVVMTSILLNGIEDGNFIPGAVAEFIINLENEGHSDIVNGKLTASTSSQYITIPVFPIPFEDLLAEGTKEIKFFAGVSEDIPEGEVVTINLLFEADFGFMLEESFETTYSDYCIPGNTSCNSGDKITRFILEDIDNSATTCETNGYSNYTNMKTVLTPEHTYTVKITCGYKNNHVSAWIDYNGDKVFAEAEKLFTVVCANADTEYSITFTVPEDAVPGEQRLRVRAKRGAEPDGPCEGWAYGQTHDYTMEITERYPKVQDVVVELVGNDVNISWKAPEEVKMSLVGYTIYRNDVCLTATPINKSEFSFEDANVAEGAYVYKVYTVYDEGESLPVCSPLIVMYEAPTGLQVSQEAGAIAVTWNATESEAMGYNVYLNKELITPAPIPLTGLTINDYEAGNHCFSVSAVYSYGESAQTKEACIEIVGICETVREIPFTLYPNPATASVTIRFEGTYAVELYNMMGQKVYSAEKASELHQISLQNLAKGVYFITVRDGEKISSQKLIVQ